MKIRGDSETVSMTASHWAVVHEFLNEDDRHTALLVHNHPKQQPVIFLLTLLFGEEPLPSLTDRQTGLKALVQRLQFKMQGLPLGRMRFFLVQNDEMAEYSGVSSAVLLDVLCSLLA